MARQNPRVKKAFDAMSAIGLAPDKVKPILKRLLKLYDGKWELIEEENYRTLADAIFEAENEEMMKSNDVQVQEPPLQKPDEATPPDQGSSTNQNRRQKLAQSSQLVSVNPTGGDVLVSGSVPDELCIDQAPSEPEPRGKMDDTTDDADVISPERKRPNLLETTTTDDVVDMVRPEGRQPNHLEITDDVDMVRRERRRPKRYEANDDVVMVHKLVMVHKFPAGPSSEPPRTANLEKNVGREGRDKRRPVHSTDDITNGTEKVKISLLDETGREELPDFVYIPHNTVYQSAYVHVSLARIADDDCCANCSGDCLSSPIPCACARDTGGEFAYTPEGNLRKEFLNDRISEKLNPDTRPLFYCKDDCPLERVKSRHHEPEKCKGHLVKRFIKECWRKCRCNMKCGNRVVQRGITRRLQVFATHEGKGWGLRALEELPEGAFVCEYVGEILTNTELYERNEQSGGTEKHTYPVLLDADWGSESVLEDEEALCLDSTYYGNVARFINHRCFDGNLIEIPVEVETPDHHYYHIAFFTKRKVKAFEELTWDYGLDFNDHKHPVKAFVCSCGSPYCRDKKGKRAKGIALN